MAEVTGPGVIEIHALAIRMAGADKHLKAELRRQFRQAANPVVAKVKQSAEDMPVHGSKHNRPPSLRKKVAGTVSSSVGVTKAGARIDIVSNGRKMLPDFPASLPELLDRPQGFAHPVFPRGDRFKLVRSSARAYRHRLPILRPMVHHGAWTWAHQAGNPHWFEEPIARSARDIQRAAEEAMTETAHHLEG